MKDRTSDIWGLAWPVMVGTMSHMFLHLVDLYWIGRLGSRELAAVAIASSLMMFLWTGTRIAHGGGVALMSQALGRGDDEGRRRAAADTLTLAGLLGVVVAVAVWAGQDAAIRFFDLDAVTARLVHEYLGIVILILPLEYLGEGATSYVVGVGRTRVMMKLGLVVNGLNLVLDPLLIFGAGPIPALGLRGAALATLVASTLFGVGILWWQVRVDGVRGSDFGWRPAGLVRVLSIGAPAAARDMSRPLVQTLMFRFVAPFGVDVVAAYGLTSRIMGMVIVYIMGLSVALTTLSGRSIGEGRPERVPGILRRGASIGLALHLVVGGSLVVLAAPVLGLFDSRGGVVSVGVPLVRIFAVMMVLPLLARVMGAAFSGSGRTTPILLSSVSSHWLVQAPLAWWAATVVGTATGVWAAIFTARVVETGILWLFYRAGSWRPVAVPKSA